MVGGGLVVDVGGWWWNDYMSFDIKKGCMKQSPPPGVHIRNK